MLSCARLISNADKLLRPAKFCYTSRTLTKYSISAPTGRLFINFKNYRQRQQGAKQLLQNLKNFLLFTSLGSTISAVSIGIMSNSADDIKGVSLAALKESDKLFDEAKYDELLEVLKKQHDWENNEQVLWRVARCEFQLAKRVEDKKDKYEELVNIAYEHVKKSLELDDKNGLAHKWAAILLNAVSTLKGTKERVLQVLNVRNHMEKAVEYAPDDPTSYYLLGEWHYSCHQVTWFERKIASIAFGKLPDADMEVALKMFEKAEEVEKDFYSKNKLMLAKTLLDLKRDKERAIEILKEVVTKYSNSEKWDDKEVSDQHNDEMTNMWMYVYLCRFLVANAVLFFSLYLTTTYPLNRHSRRLQSLSASTSNGNLIFANKYRPLSCVSYLPQHCAY